MIATFSKSIKNEIYRKAVHLSSLWMPLFIWAAPRNASIMLFLFLLLGNVAVEYAAYKKIPLIGSFFRRLFFKTLRPKEILPDKFVPSGSVYILFAALTCSVCYTREAAAAAMTVMLVSDTCAALFGKFFGSLRFTNGKSPEGTVAFFISALIILSVLVPTYPVPALVMTTSLATAAEFFETTLKTDDNLSIPLIVGFALNLFFL